MDSLSPSSTTFDVAHAIQNQKFSPGEIMVTPGALAAMNKHGYPPLLLLARHLSGDWGSVPTEDAALNDQALKAGGRLLSSYALGGDTRVWLITEHDRSVTTFLLPSEY